MSSLNKVPILTNPSIFKSNYNPNLRCTISFPADSPYTKQEFKDECDINVLMSKYLATGEVPKINERAPQYLDVTGIEFQSSMEFVAGANTLFQEMPSRIRMRFKNDPAAFLDFCSQEKNRPEMVELGLLKPSSEWVNPPASSAPAEPPVTENLPA